MVKWYNQNCTMGIKGIQDNIHTFLWKKYLNTTIKKNLFLGFPDFGTIYWISKIQSSSYMITFLNFQYEWISEILRTGRKFLFIGGIILQSGKKIFLEWMSTCYLIDIVHWLHLNTPFFIYKLHISIIKGIAQYNSL